jgi:hypothetical protein
MRLIDRIKSVFRREAPEAPSTLRNKAQGMAWINSRAAHTPGAEVLIGHAVKTVAQSSPGMWQIDPPQEFIATAPINISGGRTVPAGTSLKVIGIGDDTLDPWQEDAGGVTDKEVRELYTPQVKELRNA